MSSTRSTNSKAKIIQLEQSHNADKPQADELPVDGQVKGAKAMSDEEKFYQACASILVDHFFKNLDKYVTCTSSYPTTDH